MGILPCECLQREGVVWLQDLKSANILLARDFTAKLADVGLARVLHDDVMSTRREVGTFAWAAPEVLLGQRITEAADIYSVRPRICYFVLPAN